MDDLESRQKTGITQLDRKIKSLSTLRDQWYETENILQQLNGSLKNYENELSSLEQDSELPSDPKKWYDQVSALEHKILPLETQLIQSEDAIVQLEEHAESATTLEARTANLRARWETLRDTAKSLINYGTDLVTAGQRAQATIQNVTRNIESVKLIFDQIRRTELSQPEEINSIKDQNQRAGLLLDAASASLSTIHIQHIGPRQAKDIESSHQKLTAEIIALQQHHVEMKTNLNEGQKIWIDFEEDFRKLQHFTDRASNFDNPEIKIPIDPIKWKSECAAIKVGELTC